MQKRTYRTAAFKTKVALAAVKGDRTIAELASQFEVTTAQITEWKKYFLEHAELVFDKSKGERDKEETQKDQDILYKRIGQMSVELEFLKKKL